MNHLITLACRKLTSLFTIPFTWLMLTLALAGMSANAQTASTSTSNAAASSPGDWTQFLNNSMQRSNPYETVLNVNNVGSLQLKWTQTKVNVFSYADPIVANGVLYFVDGEDHLYAFNASTGEALWTYTLGGSFAGPTTPAVANGVVYVVSGEAIVYALNANTGAKLWSYNTNAGSPANDITVADGVVYAAMYGQGGGAGIGFMFALNASTGALLWSTSAPHEGGASTAAVANGAVYFASTDHYNSGVLVALDAHTGDRLWAYEGDPSWSAGPPVVANGVVYFTGNDGNLYAVDASTGKTLWVHDGVGSTPAPAVVGGMVFVSSARNLYALNATTGKQVWNFAVGTNELLSASPAVANGVVYISSSVGNNTTLTGTGNIYALNTSTGAKLWSYPLKGAGFSPIVTNGTVYLIDGDNNGITSVNHVNAFSIGADLFLRATPSITTVHPGDLLTYTFPVWNVGPANADHEVLMTQAPPGTTFDYI